MESKTNTSLGAPMAKNTDNDKTKFPLCPNRLCWCYDCSGKHVRSFILANDVIYWDGGDYEIFRLENAGKLRNSYLSKEVAKKNEVDSPSSTQPSPPKKREKVELGEVMTRNTWKIQFPLCPNAKCWCYDCSIKRERSIPRKFNDDLYWDNDDYEIEGLETSKSLKEAYLTSLSSLSSLSNPSS